MADKKLSEETAIGAIAGTEMLAAITPVGAAWENRQLALSLLKTWIIAQITDSAPATLDTLNELAAALGDDPNFATTVATALANKQPLDSDLTAIAALATQSFGRSLLTGASAQAICAMIGAPWVAGKSGVAVPHTGDTVKTVLATITIPAGAIGPNGQVEVIALASCNNNANSKTLSVEFGGTIYYSAAITSNPSLQAYARVSNRNSAASQVGHGTGGAQGMGAQATNPVTSSIDTTAAVNITISGQLANAADTITLESYTVRVTYGA